MKSTRTKIYFLFFAILVVVGTYVVMNDSANRLRLPSITPRTGDAGVDSEFLNTQEAIEYFRLKVRENPKRVKNYVQLAQLYLQQARISGRHHAYVVRAEEMLAEVAKRDPANTEGMLARAALLMKKHQFHEALNLAEQATRRAPYKAMAWGLLSDARKELGDYTGAVEACDRMLSLRPDLRSYSRAAHLREIHGDHTGAKKAMSLAANAGAVGLENHAWSLYQLGNLYLAEGKLDTAEIVFKNILQGRPNYPQAFSGLANVHSARGENEAALQRLLQAYDLAPEHEFIEQLVGVYLRAGKDETANVLIESVLEAFRQHERQGWNVNLEFAEFCSRYDLHLEEALQRIEEEYRRRPENIEVLEIYAWLLFKHDRIEQAAEVIEKAMRLNMRDSQLQSRAGVIAAAAGDSKLGLGNTNPNRLLVSQGHTNK